MCIRDRVRTMVDKLVSEKLMIYLEENPQVAKAIFEKSLASARDVYKRQHWSSLREKIFKRTQKFACVADFPLKSGKLVVLAAWIFLLFCFRI